MKRSSRTAALLAAAAVVWCSAASAEPPPEPTITVRGEGSVSRAPDRAFVDASIVTNDAVAAKALSDNNARYAAALARLAGAGVSPADVTTTQLSMSERPRPERPLPGDSERYGFTATRSLRITVNAVGATGAVIDAATAAGATDLGGVAFGLRDPRAAMRAALAAAVADATEQAQAIAAAAHVRIVRIARIDNGSPPYRSLSVNAARLLAAPAVPTEVPPSELDVRAAVSVTYTIR